MSPNLHPICSQLHRAGYVFLPSHLPGESSEAVARSMGAAVCVGKGGSVHQLKPKPESDAPSTTYSGIYGSNIFPLHTDLAHWRFPPRFLLLRCVAGYDAVATLLIDGAQVIENIDHVVLSRALVRPRRRVEGIFPLLRLYDRQQPDRGLLRWDEVFIRPASRAGEIGVQKFRECLARSSPISVSLAKQGDTLIIDNWRMLHGRSSVPPACSARVIERLYLEKVS
jgi:alpha-ketoglutarate-dependent taurine dioxygenase